MFFAGDESAGRITSAGNESGNKVTDADMNSGNESSNRLQTMNHTDNGECSSFGSQPRKRRRSSTIDDASKNLSDTIVESLLQRLTSVKNSAIVQRNKLLERANELSCSVSAKKIARYAAENVVPPHVDDPLQNIAQGVPAQGKRIQATPTSTATPAVAVLVKRDSLEKSVYNQNIIDRAKIINRKNAELARERLPKQPEAGKNKTHWDYLLDEAVWLSQDFREERKYKLTQTRKLSKMVLQFHGLKAARARRAARTEEVRRMRIANGIARDVRKFWSQVCDIVNYRLAQIREKEQQKHKQKHLYTLLEQTEEFSSALASHLKPSTPDSDETSGSVQEDDDEGLSGRDEEVDIQEISDDEQSEDLSEKDDVADEDELAALRNEAEIPVADVLRSQGVDTAAYIEDTRTYGDGEGASQRKEEEHGNELRKSSLGDLLGQPDSTIYNKNGKNREVRRNSSTPSGNDGKENTAEFETIMRECSKQGAEVIDKKENDADETDSQGSKDRSKPQFSVEVPTQLLRAKLRDYQQAGLEWLAALYEKKLNGILADEMGLGKTVQTIALLAWLALKKGIWGPHLIVVPTSVVLNWEVEFKKFLPGFKIMTYFGSIKERKAKRVGWTKPHNFHVCITSYTLAVQDVTALKRKKWVYLILDEAHHIKNFQSQRWQTLLGFPSYRRLLLTGTPLQNSVMELWSLMHFLMPSIFASHSEFRDWFSSPLNELVSDESKEKKAADNLRVVSRLHSVLRPFLLRRLKKDVEKGLPPKSEHVIHCSLSKRQRHLYEDFMARSETQKTLTTGDFIGVMNILMQLRKVCNHPDLFDGRPILSPFHMTPLSYPLSSLVVDLLSKDHLATLDISLLGLDLATMERKEWPGQWTLRRMENISGVPAILEEARNVRAWVVGGSKASLYAQAAARRTADSRRRILCHSAGVAELRLRKRGLYGSDLLSQCMLSPIQLVKGVKSMIDRAREGTVMIEKFGECVRHVDTSPITILCKGNYIRKAQEDERAVKLRKSLEEFTGLWRRAEIQSQISLPDTRLIQWDCGKLQILNVLLRRLKNQGSRVLIFTQMSKVLDILETFLNLHDHRYLRLDGSTKVEDRQKLMERFNQDSRVFCMILTTRSGGLGLNLTGADCVIFYDNDWNPAMDAQAQDRAHRIGQTKPVKIYRLVSSRTVEENILTKANQRRSLESLVISKAGFTTDSFRQRINVRELITPLDEMKPLGSKLVEKESSDSGGIGKNSDVVGSPYRSSSDDSRMARSGSSREVVPVPRVPPDRLIRGTSPAGAVPNPPAGSPFRENGSTGDYSKWTTDSQGMVMESENVDASLQETLMDEKERAGLYEAKREEQIAAAEFCDDSDTGIAGDKKDPNEDPLLEYGLFRNLRPVERYALQVLEQCIETVPIESKDLSVNESLEKEFSLNEMLKRRMNEEEAREQELLDANTKGKEQVRNEELTSPNGTDFDHYELDYSEQGVASYLKALAGADVHIRIYIGLRDGGPEELVLSTVVNGTSASGLECAEDAAFFPHAYNRMTRTAHATRRQQEKYLAKMARRKVEQARKNALLATGYSGIVGAGNGSMHMNGIYDEQRGGTLMNGYSNGPALKRARLDGKGGVLHGSAGNASLFKRSSKKISSRKSLMAPTRSWSGASDSLRDIGINDDWTVEQDQELVEYAAMYGNNMYVASDALRMHPGVAAGIRARKTPQQCASRMLNVLTPKRSGVLGAVGKPPQRDLAILNKRMDEMIKAARIIESRRNASRPTFGSSPSHASHAILEGACTSIGLSKFSPMPLQAAEVDSQYHQPGRKATETSTTAIARRRRPFLRPLKEHRRMGNLRIAHNPVSLRDTRAATLRELQQQNLPLGNAGSVVPHGGSASGGATNSSGVPDITGARGTRGTIPTPTLNRNTVITAGASMAEPTRMPVTTGNNLRDRALGANGWVIPVSTAVAPQLHRLNISHASSKTDGATTVQQSAVQRAAAQRAAAQQAATRQTSAQQVAASAASATRAARQAAAKGVKHQ